MTDGKTSDLAYLRSSQVAKLLQVSTKTIGRWAREGKLDSVKTLGGHRRYSRAAVEQLLSRLNDCDNGEDQTQPEAPIRLSDENKLGPGSSDAEKGDV